MIVFAEKNIWHEGKRTCKVMLTNILNPYRLFGQVRAVFKLSSAPRDRPKENGRSPSFSLGAVLVGLLMVNLRRRHFVKRRMRASMVVEVEVGIQARARLSQVGPLMERAGARGCC